MTFRTSEYLQRYELVRYQLDDVIRIPANGQHQQKTGYKFAINDRSSHYDWYNAYFEVQFQLQKLADGARYVVADRIAVINGAHSLISHMTIKSVRLCTILIISIKLLLSRPSSNVVMILVVALPKTLFGIWIQMPPLPTLTQVSRLENF